MAPNNSLRRLCGKEETFKEAETLLNLARAKTNLGSGRSLGGSVVGLPAICAFLASNRLGNNDVVEKVAQEASCLDPKRFKAALSTVRGALSQHLQEREHHNVSFKSLCLRYNVNVNAIHWMEQVEKELVDGKYLPPQKAAKDTTLCAVFYWTCIKLNIRAVKSRSIILDFDLESRVFQDTEDLIEDSCQGIADSIEESLKESRENRSSPSKPHQELPVTPRQSELIVSSDTSPLKRKAPLPSMLRISPVKRPRVASPTKLNRLPVTPAKPSPTKSPAPSGSASSTPLKTYRSSRSFKGSETKTMSLPESIAEDKACTTSKAAIAVVDSNELSTPIAGSDATEETIPVGPVGQSVACSTAIQESSSALKTTQTSFPAPEATVAEVTTPRTLRTRVASKKQQQESGRSTPKASRMSARSPANAKPLIENSDPEESESEEARPPPCRHHIPAFVDRAFYHYREPRVLREWEICEKNMKAVVAKFGSPLIGATA